jgi:NAD(P)H-dependent flavin oxidoreductase YrpB (nitropropane dioxygenase family)
MWPNRELLDFIGIDLPIIQAPMAGANGAAMAIAVSNAGGLGSLHYLGARRAEREGRRHATSVGDAAGGDKLEN